MSLVGASTAWRYEVWGFLFFVVERSFVLARVNSDIALYKGYGFYWDSIVKLEHGGVRELGTVGCPRLWMWDERVVVEKNCSMKIAVNSIFGQSRNARLLQDVESCRILQLVGMRVSIQ